MRYVRTCFTVRPLRDLLRVLSFDGRSRFRTETVSQVGDVNPHKAARAPATGRIAPRARLRLTLNRKVRPATLAVPRW